MLLVSSQFPFQECFVAVRSSLHAKGGALFRLLAEKLLPPISMQGSAACTITQQANARQQEE